MIKNGYLAALSHSWTKFLVVPGGGSSRDSITFQNRLIFRLNVAIAGQQPKELAAAADSG